MSEAAKSALINTASARQGSAVNASREVTAELSRLGLIGDKGLTRRGTIERERAVNAALNAAF